jgi:F420-0:gamma-glutamyl ligase-like protein
MRPMLSKLKVKRIRTRYWRPGEDYAKIIAESLKSHVDDGDFVVVSEKAISTAKGNIIDEGKIKPGLVAKLLASIWMRFVWGRFLGYVCNLQRDAIEHLINYPYIEGASHKQLAIRTSTVLQSLKHGSEGGIDLSNLPYAYACLPLKDPYESAEEIRLEILKTTSKSINVILSDTDSTFTYRNVHFTTHPNPIKGILSYGGFITYILGRFFELKQRATPIAIVGIELSIEDVLRLAELAHRARGSGAGRTVWNVAKRFDVGFNEVSWGMMNNVPHYPVVLIRCTTDSSNN